MALYVVKRIDGPAIALTSGNVAKTVTFLDTTTGTIVVKHIEVPEADEGDRTSWFDAYTSAGMTPNDWDS